MGWPHCIDLTPQIGKDQFIVLHPAEPVSLGIPAKAQIGRSVHCSSGVIIPCASGELCLLQELMPALFHGYPCDEGWGSFLRRICSQMKGPDPELVTEITLI